LFSCAGADAGDDSGIKEPAEKTPLAAGGTVEIKNIDGSDYEIHTFAIAGGETIVTAGVGSAAVFSFVPSADVTADVLIVAGGGGGGGAAYQHPGGGGGAGGFIQSSGIAFTAGTYTVWVGKGGQGGTGNSTSESEVTNMNQGSVANGKNGGNSWIDHAGLVQAAGGGGGARHRSGSGYSGEAGGSGGGGTSAGNGGTVSAAGQGNAGGKIFGACSGGGGGGAGAAGLTISVSTDNTNSAGGDGSPNSITGTAVYYAGGGASGITNGAPLASASYKPGGQGGGGGSGEPGVDGLGGGGGGGNGMANDGTPGAIAGRIGGAGGDGIVIIRFPWTAAP
jgi:hypothetical protein